MYVELALQLELSVSSVDRTVKEMKHVMPSVKLSPSGRSRETITDGGIVIIYCHIVQAITCKYCFPRWHPDCYYVHACMF
jgi:hypothetical protein